MRYPVTLTRDDNDTMMVSFPDVPGAVTYGDTEEEALARATDAVLTVFDALIKDRQDIPEPSAIGHGGLFVTVPALESSKIGLYREMRAKKVGKAELGRRLNWHLPQVDRLLDVHHASQLNQIEAGFRVLGKRLMIVLDDEDPVTTTLRAGHKPVVGMMETIKRSMRDVSPSRRRSHTVARPERTSAFARKVAGKKR